MKPLRHALFAGMALLLGLAHAEDGPNPFKALGKLLAPATSKAATDNRTLKVTATGHGRRVALVIGNGDYQHTDSLPKLANPTHDAEDIAKALRGFGFDVIERKNLSLEGMNDAITEFSRKIGDSEAALFYFAGHGLQVKGQNYLIPTSAKIESEARVPYESINVNMVLDEMENAQSKFNIVMLDACRNNPISGKFRSGTTRGLAAPSSQPKGTIIVYATDPGNVAADGDGRNGLFSEALLKAFSGKDLSLGGVLYSASEYVEQKSHRIDPARKQTPYVNGPETLKRQFRFDGDGAQVVQLGPGIGGGARSAEQIEDELWDAIKGSSKAGVFEKYLENYSRGRYRAQAEVKLADLKGEAKPSPVAVKPLSAPPPPAKADDPDTSLWKAVEQGNSSDDYDVYLKQYPKGKYVALAKQRSQKLKDEARQKAEAEEQSVWQTAESTQTADGYAVYLASYPNGKFAALAQTRNAKLKREAADREKLEAARLQGEQAEAERKAKEDAARGPQWAESDNGYGINWNEATQYCASKGSGWRLPTVAELQASYLSGHSIPCEERTCKFSSNSRLTNTWFWSNERNGSTHALGVTLEAGFSIASLVENRGNYRALCVRRP